MGRKPRRSNVTLPVGGVQARAAVPQAEVRVTGAAGSGVDVVLRGGVLHAPAFRPIVPANHDVTIRVAGVSGTALMGRADVTVRLAQVGTLVEGYDPTRLGASLLLGNDWSSVSLGSLASWGQESGRDWAYGIVPTTEAQVVTDPLWGKVYRLEQKPYTTAAATTHALVHYHAGASARIWTRAVIKLDGNGNTNGIFGDGFTSYGSAPSGSTTYKMLFLYSTDMLQRLEYELYLDGKFLLTGSTIPGNNYGSETASALSQGGAPVAPVAAHGYLSGWLDNAVGLRDEEWYEYVQNMDYSSGTLLQRFFIRKLTVNGAWSPSTYPSWMGWRITNSQAREYSQFWTGGNKSQQNDGPNSQYVYFGPFEVSTAADPYGWDQYGR